MKQLFRLNHIARAIAAAALVALATCGGIDNFTITESATSTIPGSPVAQLLGNIGFGGFTGMDISSNEELQNQGVKRNEIDSVKLRSLVLTITDTSSGQNFDFLDSISFYVEAPGLEKKLVAQGSNFASGLTEIGLDVLDVELADYASQDSMDVTTEATGQQPSNNTTVEATMTIDVDVDVSGALCG